MRRLNIDLRNLAAAAALPALLSACSGIENAPSSHVLIPAETLNVSRSLSIPAESLVAAGLLFVVVDPLAPNWRIEQATLGEGRYRIALRKKRFTTGGDGEAVQVLRRRGEQLSREYGGGGYRIVEFSEGIESSTPIAQRVAQGIVEIVREDRGR